MHNLDRYFGIKCADKFIGRRKQHRKREKAKDKIDGLPNEDRYKTGSVPKDDQYIKILFYAVLLYTT